MRILFALPGLHRYDRGAEVAFLSVARELVALGNDVTLIGSGNPRPGTPYRFLSGSSMRRERFERFPALPVLRNEYAYEELTFVPSLLHLYRPAEYDVTLTCGYPFTNWVLRRPVANASRPPHVFVTQNGDWPARARNSEYRFFGCEGLVCINPDYYERNKKNWPSRLIPNGVDCSKFTAGPSQRPRFGISPERIVVLMVSALIPSKRVDVGIDVVAKIPDAHLVVAGDGPLRGEIEAKATRLLQGRFTRITVSPAEMPALYRSADVFLHLSKDESFGNVYVEAMACGLPVVAHDSPRSRWVLGDDEFLTDTNDIGLIVQRIHQANQSRAAIQVRATKAEAFSWTRIGSMYEEFLHEIVEGSARRRARNTLVADIH